MGHFQERRRTLEMYGAEAGQGTFAMLSAGAPPRRKSVRLSEIFHDHGPTRKFVADSRRIAATPTRLPRAHQDLKQRWSVDIRCDWGGDSVAADGQGGDDGRDHLRMLYDVVAGGGVKRASPSGIRRIGSMSRAPKST